MDDMLDLGFDEYDTPSSEISSSPPMCPNCNCVMCDIGDKWACQMCPMVRSKAKQEVTCEAPVSTLPPQCPHPQDKENSMPISGRKFCSLCGDWI